MKKFKIAFISSEAVPFIKSGGLADVSGAIVKALARNGHEVILLLPRYGEIKSELVSPESCVGPLTVPFGFDEKFAAVRRSNFIPGVKTYFIEHDYYFARKGLYGDDNNEFSDNSERFTFFSRAALQALIALNFKPDIIHCNDWQTGLIPVFLKTHYRDEFHFFNSRSIMTIHNMRYQGIFNKDSIFFSQLGWKMYSEECLKFYDAINFLKAGLLWCDAITTVSEKYANEISSPEFGYELSGIIKSRISKVTGILNGVDYAEWNPETDKHIASNYSPSDLSGKKKCKTALQKKMNLPQKSDIPVLASITRVTHQKGMDQFAAVLGNILTANKNLQYILHGTGDSGIIQMYRALEKLYPGNISVNEGYNEKTAHAINAGADIFIMPSRYEPCGLSQMYSMKYGTIPVVNATGGLDDTITNWNSAAQKGNGFKFHKLESMSLLETINNVLNEFEDKKNWNALVQNAMKYNSSWDDSIIKYEKVYEALINARYDHSI